MLPHTGVRSTKSVSSLEMHGVSFDDLVGAGVATL